MIAGASAYYSSYDTTEAPTTEETTTAEAFDPADRLAIIQHHFGVSNLLIDGRKKNLQRIVESLPSSSGGYSSAEKLVNWADRYVKRSNKIFEKAAASSNGESCYEENGFGSDDSADDVNVFDESNFCKLNGQVNAALNSWARNYACDGRGKVYRQIIRSARKVRNFYNDKAGC